MLIGTLSGISAAAILILFGQRPQTIVRDVPVERQGPDSALTARILASNNPSPGLQPLCRILPKVQCDAMPLEKFINWIAKATGTQCYVEWRELAGGSAAGPDSLVTLDLRNVTAAAALPMALDQSRLAGDRIGFVRIDGVIKISLKNRLDHWTTLRVYDVHDLIEQAVKSKPARDKLRLADKNTGGQDRSIGNPTETSTDPETEAVQLLRSVILKCVDEDAWPNSCEISYFSGRFIICDTTSNQDLITAMLAALRANPN